MPRLVETDVGDSRLVIDRDSVSALIHFLDTADIPWTIPEGDLAIAFVDEATCKNLHTTFFQDDSVTDVMTFPGMAEDDHAGDLAICPAYASAHAAEYGQSFAEELTLYLIHGWLHLAGLDDRTEVAIAEMRSAEKTVMERLHLNNRILEAFEKD